MTEPVNQFHKTLRVLSEQDPTFERAIAFGEGAIRLRGYAAVRHDPGMVAWVMENEKPLKHIADARRAAYAQANA